MSEPSTLILACGTVELQAAAADGKRPTFTINAYSGGPMRLKGFELPVIVDLATAKSGESVLVLRDHDERSIVGQGQAVIRGTDIAIHGTVTADRGPGADVVSHAKNGFRWQASIGGSQFEREYLAGGQNASINGRLVTGPMIIARNFVLKEVSFVGLGADPTTSAAIAAKRTNEMETTTQIDAIAAERARITDINRLCADSESIAARAVAEGWTTERTELEMLRGFKNQAELESIRAGRGALGSSSRATQAGASMGQAITASMLISAGLPEETVGKFYGEQVMNSAVSRQCRGAGLQSAFRAVLKADGRHEDLTTERFSDETIRASFEASGHLRAEGFSTLSLPGILGDFLNKMMLASYNGAATTYQYLTSTKPLTDFKPLHLFRLVGTGEFHEIGPAGELKHIGATEQTYSVEAATYGALILLTRQSVINDDLGAFGQFAQILGRLGAVKLEQVIYTLLMSNPSSFFSSGNGNYQTGGGSALGLASLASAEKLFRLQVDDNGLPILSEPRTLLVGPSNAVAARQLLQSTDLVQNQIQATSPSGLASQSPSGNPFVAQLKPAVSPWLENATIVGNSTTRWYVVGDANDMSPLVTGFLGGRSVPTVQIGEPSFDTLGIGFRAFFDFGVATQDYRGAVMSDGQ